MPRLACRQQEAARSQLEVMFLTLVLHRSLQRHLHTKIPESIAIEILMHFRIVYPVAVGCLYRHAV